MVRIPRVEGPVTRQRLHHSGADPVRVLLIGERVQLAADGPSLVQRAVDRVWLTTRRGVDLDALADLAPVLRRVTADAEDWRLWRYDAIVVLLGSRTALRRREQVLEQLGDLLQQDAEHGTPVVLIAAVAGESEERLLQRAQRLGGERLHVVEATDEDDRSWATAIGREVDGVLRTTPPAAADPQDEAARQHALDETGIVDGGPDPRLDDLVELARTAFGTESAAITFLDHDRQWRLAVAGPDRMGDERADAFCNRTIERPGPLVVGDTTRDPVLRSSPLASGPRPIRFYAAHPIESVDGYRIGSFCVYDSEPRDVRGMEVSVLRDLALLAQAELIAHDSAPQGLPARLRRA